MIRSRQRDEGVATGGGTVRLLAIFIFFVGESEAPCLDSLNR
jgi:hypothetical protein